jgi:hypothetical protein
MTMELLIIILNKAECLAELLSCMMEAKICGATVVDSQGMLTVLGKEEGKAPPIFSSLRYLFNPDKANGKMVLVVLDKEQVSTVRAIVNKVTGGLGKPNTGILFTLPLSYVEGVAAE